MEEDGGLIELGRGLRDQRAPSHEAIPSQSRDPIISSHKVRVGPAFAVDGRGVSGHPFRHSRADGNPDGWHQRVLFWIR